MGPGPHRRALPRGLRALEGGRVTGPRAAGGGTAASPSAPGGPAGPTGPDGQTTKQGVTVEEQFLVNIAIPDPPCVKRGGLSACRKECEAKVAASCTTVGFFDRDETSRRGWFTLGCDLGDLDGCHHLARSWKHGDSRDVAKAISLYVKACDGGHPGACGSLGSSYAIGDGVPKDEKRAFSLYEKGCEANDPYSCARLGDCYERGTGVPVDPAKARVLYEKACAGGVFGMDGCLNLARLLKDGKGGPKDEARAKEILERACKIGYPNACK